MKKKLFIASDHGAFELKEYLKTQFTDLEWNDLGCFSKESVDYPDYAKKICLEIKKHFNEEQLLNPCGVLLCGSGVGVSIQANRFSWIRAALVESEEVAKLSRQHNASNVLCMGGRIVSNEKASIILKSWLGANFEAGRHLGRIQKLQ
jgi:ribose 5-phosphate isomerase B